LKIKGLGLLLALNIGEMGKNSKSQILAQSWNGGPGKDRGSLAHRDA
jgi:hypothetical protein